MVSGGQVLQPSSSGLRSNCSAISPPGAPATCGKKSPGEKRHFHSYASRRCQERIPSESIIITSDNPSCWTAAALPTRLVAVRASKWTSTDSMHSFCSNVCAVFSVNIRTEESGMCKCCFNIYLKRVQISGIVRVIWPGNSHRQRYREKLERARLILITVLGEKQKEHVFNRYTVYEASEHTSQALSIWHNDSLRAMFWQLSTLR